MSTQERIDVRGRDGSTDPAFGRSAGPVGTGPRMPDRLPRPPGRRRPGLAVLGVLLIVAGAAVAGLLALRIDDRVEVLVARQDISAGQRIEADDLAVARLSSSGVAVIPAGQADQVVGRYAAQAIGAGRLIDAGQLGGSGLLTPGKVAVGLSLATGRYPANGLRIGDIVQIVRAVNGTGKVLTNRAVISGVRGTSDSSSLGGSGSSNGTVVTVVVTEAEGPAVAAAAMADQISVVLVTRGAPAGGG